MNSEDTKQIARRAFQALMDGDLDPLRDLLAPEAVLHQCGFLKPIPAEAILRGDFPGRRRVQDRDVRIEEIISEDNIVALRWRTSGVFSDPESSKRDSTPVSFPSMSFMRVENSRIAEIWNIQDTSTLQTQLWEASHQDAP